MTHRISPLVRAIALTALAALFPPGADAGGKGEPRSKGASQNRLYIVQMSEAPVVAYEGDIPGLKATAPKKGQKIDPNSPQVVDYAAYLDKRHADLVTKAGGRKVYDYRYSFNGFSAEMTAQQAAALSRMPGVVAVTKDEARTQDTASTPAFLGLDATGGLWSQLGGVGSAGEDVIIGIIDGGIWPESLSFSDRTGANGNASKDGKLSYQQIPGWHGRCVPGDRFAATHCNQKLIGARWYNAGWGGDAGIRYYLPWEFVSPRDLGGHGTHTASTAGGNANVPVTGPVAVFGAKTSGIAPRARIAAYKTCWETGAGGSCFTTDNVAAIDQAVADGVDVINFSISGTRTNFLDPVEVAFLYAARAGVFVAASAGNSGPTTSTVAHPSPWINTVAAGTHNRAAEGSTTLGNGGIYSGASVNPTALPASALIDAEAASLPGATATAARLCFAAEDNGGVPALDPAKVAGKVVLCDRGTNARTNKSLAVKQAGGVGMILVNTSSNSLNSDFHYVPSVHLQNTDRAALKAYAADVSPTASIARAAAVFNSPAPFTASFSSRGPLIAGGGDILKPDMIAPGQDVLASVAPPGNGGRSFDLYSGTSMSSPHVAGLGALLKDRFPGWTPMRIKSALMTSAGNVRDGADTDPLVIFRQGAGHVNPNGATDPGLVFDSGFNDWLAFLCGATTGVPAGTCASLRSADFSTDPSDLNQASIAIGDLAGTQTVVRRVTNVGSSAATYTASVTGLSGITVDVAPASFGIAPGATRTFRVSFTRTTANLNAWSAGQLVLTDGSHVVRSPVVVAPVALAVPAALSGNGTATSYGVKFGYDGSFSAQPVGLVAASLTADTVADDPTDASCSPSAPNAKTYPVSIAAGTVYARFALFDADVNAGSDLDLCVYSGATPVAGSAGATSAEEVLLTAPAAGDYTVVVQGWGVAGSTPFKLNRWILDGSSAGNMSVTAPASASIGATGQISLGFAGLTAGTRYTGAVSYSGSSGMPSPTLLRITTP